MYLSGGNLPSQMAHTKQIANMSQALSKKIRNFELVTSGDIWSAFRGIDGEFKSWYGLHHDFRLVRLPIHLKTSHPFPQNYTFKRFFKMAALYACLKSPSLVYTRTPAIVTLLLELGVPILWEWHETIDDKSPYRSFFSNRNLIGVVTLSPQLAENYIEQGLAPEKVLVAHSAVELSNFLPYLEKDQARQRLSIPQDAKIILYSGHLYDYKGIPTLLETAQLMPEYQFVLVGGWADDVNRVKAICEKDNLRNVAVVGHVSQSELTSYLYAADVLILPTSKLWHLAETTSPLKLFEYMAVRRPIVASSLPNIMTVLQDGKNAILANPDDSFSFKQAIFTLFENSSLATVIAENAFEGVQNFTWDGRTDLVLQFAKERLEGGNINSANRKKRLIRYFRDSLKLS
jgi:glycosyltransferase involved in cell wall biosynthesis